MKSVKRKAITQNLKFKYIFLSIEHHISYLKTKNQKPVSYFMFMLTTNLLTS